MLINHKTHLPVLKKSLPLHTDYVQLINPTSSWHELLAKPSPKAVKK